MVKKKLIMLVCCAVVAALVCSVTFAEKEGKNCTVTAAIEAAIKAMMPNAVIGNCSKEEEEIHVYEVKVSENKQNSEVKLTEDGTVVEIEGIVAPDALPAPVVAAIKAQNGEAKKVEKSTEYAQLKMVKLDTPVTTYETEIVKDGKEIEIKLAADGTILEQKEEKKEGKHKDKDEDDKD